MTPPRTKDNGLQAERTALAWNRTGLAVLVNALLALRTGWVSADKPINILALVLLIASGAVILYGAYRRRHLLNGREVIVLPRLAITITSIVALVTCIVGIATILIP